jgi:hypothetical protein
MREANHRHPENLNQHDTTCNYEFEVQRPSSCISCRKFGLHSYKTKVKAPTEVHQPRLIMNFVDDIEFITESFVPDELLYEPQRFSSALHDANSMPELISASDKQQRRI